MQAAWTAVAAFITSHQWMPVAIVVIGWLVSLTNDWSRFPLTVPDRWKPVVAVILGQAYGVLVAVRGGLPWDEAAAHGLSAALFTMGLFDLVVKAAFGDKPLPKWIAWLRLISVPKSAPDAAASAGDERPTAP